MLFWWMKSRYVVFCHHYHNSSRVLEGSPIVGSHTGYASRLFWPKCCLLRSTTFVSPALPVVALPAHPVCFRMASRPSDCLPALSSASLGMHTAQTEAFDKLYATEFKRFIAGKIVSLGTGDGIVVCSLTRGFSRLSKQELDWDFSRLIRSEGILAKSSVRLLSYMGAIVLADNRY